MKKISCLFILFIILINIGACTGYKPIFGSSNLEFKIADYSILGDKNLGSQIYSKLYNLSRSNKKTSETKNIYLLINISKEKNATAKDSTGKILGYKINLNTKLEAIDYVTNKSILEQDFNSSSNYKIQSRYSESLALEGKTINDLIEKTYQDILFNLFQNIKSK